MSDWLVPALLACVVIGAGVYVFLPSKEAPAPPKVAATRPAASPGASIVPIPAAKPVRGGGIFSETKPAETGPTDPLKLTEEWKHVEEAVVTGGGRALYVIEDYRTRNPGVLTKDLDQLANEVLDRIWWRRVEDLCRRREALQAQLEKLDGEIGEESNAEYKQKLVKEREGVEAERGRISETIASELKFTRKAAPNIHDDSEIQVLRAERDPGLFRTWGEGVVKSAKTRLGALPWERTR